MLEVPHGAAELCRAAAWAEPSTGRAVLRRAWPGLTGSSRAPQHNASPAAPSLLSDAAPDATTPHALARSDTRSRFHDAWAAHARPPDSHHCGQHPLPGSGPTPPGTLPMPRKHLKTPGDPHST